jgi:hypothetical protein
MSISNTDNVIDSRDVLDRIEELEFEAERTEAENNELALLQKFIEDASRYSAERARHGFSLIHDDYFQEYAIELCQECGDLPRNIPSYIEIDWEATAKNIQQDYAAVNFDGETYWVRC